MNKHFFSFSRIPIKRNSPDKKKIIKKILGSLKDVLTKQQKYHLLDQYDGEGGLLN